MNTKVNIKRSNEKRTKQQYQKTNLNKNIIKLTLNKPNFIFFETNAISLQALPATSPNKTQINTKKRIRLINIYDNKIGLRTYY